MAAKDYAHALVDLLRPPEGEYYMKWSAYSVAWNAADADGWHDPSLCNTAQQLWKEHNDMADAWLTDIAQAVDALRGVFLNANKHLKERVCVTPAYDCIYAADAILRVTDMKEQYEHWVANEAARRRAMDAEHASAAAVPTDDPEQDQRTKKPKTGPTFSGDGSAAPSAGEATSAPRTSPDVPMHQQDPSSTRSLASEHTQAPPEGVPVPGERDGPRPPPPEEVPGITESFQEQFAQSSVPSGEHGTGAGGADTAAAPIAAFKWDACDRLGTTHPHAGWEACLRRIVQ
jgi:hypothetical protein